MYTRFAIYFCPEPSSALESFGRHWLGWDLDLAQAVEQPEVTGFDIEAITERPRKYGFHGTLKAPFRLADGQTLEELSKAADTITAAIAPFEIPKLHVAKIGKFLAIIEAEPCQPLRDMASHIVTAFEPFRAPLTQADLERRRKSDLTEAQDAHLVKWGYPYVFDEFKFHLTLSGPLSPDLQEVVKDEAKRVLGDTLSTPYLCQSISLCAECEDGRFKRLSRHVFGG